MLAAAGDKRRSRRWRGGGGWRLLLGLLLLVKGALVALGAQGAWWRVVEPAVAVAADVKARPESAKELAGLLEAVRRRTQELDRREAALREEEKRVKVLVDDAARRLKTLEALEVRVAAGLEKIRAAENGRAQSLAKIYEAMEPKDAAPILERLDERTVAAILAHMREKQIGLIMPFLSPEKAVRFTAVLAEQPRPPAVAARR